MAIERLSKKQSERLQRTRHDLSEVLSDLVAASYSSCGLNFGWFRHLGFAPTVHKLFRLDIVAARCISSLMGSTGTGRLTDYSGGKRERREPKGTSSSETGDAPAHDPCTNAFSTKLEDVARSQYYASKGALPANGTHVDVKLSGRLLVYTAEGDLGFLPTQYNYLAGCINRGFKYGGSVTSTATTPVPTISVEITPI